MPMSQVPANWQFHPMISELLKDDKDPLTEALREDIDDLIERSREIHDNVVTILEGRMPKSLSEIQAKTKSRAAASYLMDDISDISQIPR